MAVIVGKGKITIVITSCRGGGRLAATVDENNANQAEKRFPWIPTLEEAGGVFQEQNELPNTYNQGDHWR